MDIFNVASALFGSSRVEETDGISNTVDSISAIGATDSDSGSVGLTMDADITPADDAEGDETIFDVPTSPAVASGDDVVVGLTGNGPLKVPIVLANPGSGDRQQTQIDNAVTLAETAEQVAQATGQYFWSDTDGAHVTQVTKDEWNDSTSPNYHSGPNSLWNSLGMLFRDGLTNLLAVLSNGIAIYDGLGNAASNIIAEFTANLVRIGGRFATSGSSTAKVQFFEDDSALTKLTAEHYINKTVEPRVSHSLALSATTTDDELPAGTSRTVTGNVNVWEQIYNDGSNYSDEVTVSLNGSTTNRTSHVSMGVQAIQSNSLWQRVAFVVADTLRLTYGAGEQATVWSHAMSGVIRAITNADKANTWVTVSAANWATMNSGYSILASDLKYNAYQHRIIGSLQIRETTGHSAGNNVCGTVKAAYRPPARQIIHTTTNGAYKMFVDSGGGLTLVLGSATSANTDHWFALDYIVDD